MNRKHIVFACRLIACVLGKEESPYTGSWLRDDKCFNYEDDDIAISAALDSLELYALIKKNNNPFLGVDKKGEIYRWHGEVNKVYAHIIDLFDKSAHLLRNDYFKFEGMAAKWKEEK